MPLLTSWADRVLTAGIRDSEIRPGISLDMFSGIIMEKLTDRNELGWG